MKEILTSTQQVLIKRPRFHRPCFAWNFCEFALLHSSKFLSNLENRNLQYPTQLRHPRSFYPLWKLRAWAWNSQFCQLKMVLNVLSSQPSSFPLPFVWPLSRHSVRVNVVRFCSKRSLKGIQWFYTSKNHSKFPVIAQAHQIWTRKQTILRCMYPKYVREAGSTPCVLFEVSFIYSERYRAFLSHVKIPYF